MANIKDETVLLLESWFRTLCCNGHGKNQHVEAGQLFDVILSYCLVQQGHNMHRDLATLVFKIEGKFHFDTETSEGRMLYSNSEFPLSKESDFTKTLRGKTLSLPYLLEANLVWFTDDKFLKKLISWCLNIKSNLLLFTDNMVFKYQYLQQATRDALVEILCCSHKCLNFRYII